MLHFLVAIPPCFLRFVWFSLSSTLTLYLSLETDSLTSQPHWAEHAEGKVIFRFAHRLKSGKFLHSSKDFSFLCFSLLKSLASLWGISRYLPRTYSSLALSQTLIKLPQHQHSHPLQTLTSFERPNSFPEPGGAVLSCLHSMKWVSLSSWHKSRNKKKKLSENTHLLQKKKQDHFILGVLILTWPFPCRKLLSHTILFLPSGSVQNNT